jgi:hypothetical protein
MAAIEAANGIIQQQANSGIHTDETSPDYNLDGRKGPESPKKLKLTLKGDKYIQKIQKQPRDDGGSEYQQHERSMRQSNDNSDSANM